MKKKLIFVAMLVSLLAFSLIFVGCDDGSTSDGDSGGSGGTTVGGDDAFLGTWVSDNSSTITLKFKTMGSGSKTVYSVNMFGVSSEYQASDGKVNVNQGKATFDYTINGNKLTVTNFGGTDSRSRLGSHCTNEPIPNSNTTSANQNKTPYHY
jgi:uncharacterized lipoprotein YehR (DUF1307 family)